MTQPRRPKGTGSIRVRGAKFEATYSFTDQDGNRRRRSSTFDTKTDARRWLTERQADISVRDGVVNTSGEDLTTSEFLFVWLEGLTDHLSPKTVTWYRWAATKHIIPALGHLPIAEVSTAHIDRLLSELSDHAKGETLRAVRVTIGKAMKEAVRTGLVGVNPADSAQTPRVAKRDATIDVWNPEEIAAFIDAVADDRLAALWRTATMTGLRRSEVCGLQWRDIDLEGEALVVRRAIVVDVGKPVVKEPKTARSSRTVDLDGDTAQALSAWRRRQITERLRAGEAWNDGDWVFTDPLGVPLNPEWVGKRFKRLVGDHQLRPITMRQLRHSHATALLRAGVHPKVVQERLGHSSIVITLDIYSSVLPTMQREAVDRLMAIVDPVRPGQSDSAG
jgi:integrase